MSINLLVDDGRILLQADAEVACLDRVERVSGRMWDTTRNAWSFPATPETARQVREAFRGFGTARVSKSFQQLLNQGNARFAIGQLVEGELPDIPLTKTPAWNHQKEAFWFIVNLWGGLPNADVHESV